MSLNRKIKRLILGTPLDNSAIEGERYGVFWGLPILSSDAISSVAYAGQEMLLVLVPAIGILAFKQLTVLSFAIICLLFILMLSYRQTIDHYPNGGGAFIVSKENLGVTAGVAAGAALSIDYILTVAVSISSGVEQITTVFPVLKHHHGSVIISIILILLLMVGNLRGIRESSKLFGVPAYAFMFSIISMLAVGFYNFFVNGVTPPPPDFHQTVEPLSLLLMLKAFSGGCTALTGIEAVSNAVPNFKSPSTKHAKTVLLLLSLIILVLFGGISLLANIYQVIPGDRSMIVLMSRQIFGNSFMYYFVTATTFIILILAANTAYSGFPMLISVMAREGYAPRQLSMRGDRLAFDNGIILLTIVAALLVIVFDASVTSLLGLYAIGVFISFTLSQTGMFVKQRREKGPRWQLKSFINGFGALVTSIVVIIIAVEKFSQGAWLVVFLIPLLSYMILKVKRHYKSVYNQLHINSNEYENYEIGAKKYKTRVIVPIESINKSSIRALRYAKTVSEDIVAFNVTIDEESANELKRKFERINAGIPLIIEFSPYREIVAPLLRFIESEQYSYKEGEIITVILPQFVVHKWWQRILHNNTGFYLNKELLKNKNIVVSFMPLHLQDD